MVLFIGFLALSKLKYKYFLSWFIYQACKNVSQYLVLFYNSATV